MVKNPLANAGDRGGAGSISGLGRSPGNKMQLTPVFLPGKFHGQRSLAGYSPWGFKELDMTEQVSAFTHPHTYTVVVFLFSLFCRYFCQGEDISL